MVTLETFQQIFQMCVSAFKDGVWISITICNTANITDYLSPRLEKVRHVKDKKIPKSEIWTLDLLSSEALQMITIITKGKHKLTFPRAYHLSKHIGGQGGGQAGGYIIMPIRR